MDNRPISYNIITGELKKEYPLNSTSRRFASLNEIRKVKENQLKFTPVPKVRKLGTSTDTRRFVYSMGGDSADGPLSQTEQKSQYQSEKTSLINASKLPYNPITHVTTFQTMDLWRNTRRLAPFSKETHMGRFNAPNYSKEYADKLNEDKDNFHRKKSPCTELCHIQRSYGVGKFFRKYK
jgi:hypothetical protein